MGNSYKVTLVAFILIFLMNGISMLHQVCFAACAESTFVTVVKFDSMPKFLLVLK